MLDRLGIKKINIFASYNDTSDYHLYKMKKKFTQFLSEKIKDMGLSEKAVAELVELGSAGLKDDASDDDIKAKVDSVVPFAKVMQGEYTRKVQDAKQSLQQHNRNRGGEGGSDDGDEGKNKGGDNEIPAWFKDIQKSYDDKISALENENASLKAAKAKEQRDGLIAAKAKELGIPDFLMKHISIEDDADFSKVLTEYKQELVNNKLMPANEAGEQGTAEQAMKDAAKSWAESLPNK